MVDVKDMLDCLVEKMEPYKNREEVIWDLRVNQLFGNGGFTIYFGDLGLYLDIKCEALIEYAELIEKAIRILGREVISTWKTQYPFNKEAW